MAKALEDVVDIEHQTLTKNKKAQAVQAVADVFDLTLPRRGTKELRSAIERRRAEIYAELGPSSKQPSGKKKGPR